MPAHQGFAEVNGSRLYYETAGSGAPLVFIHGLGADSSLWNAQLEAFAKHYLVLRYDLRGHGQSALPTGEPYSHVADLNALLEHLNIPSAHLIGQSLGGGIALDFALEHPEKTASLVLTDSSLNGYAWSQAWGESWAPLVAAAPLGKDTWLPVVLEHPMFTPGCREPSFKARLAQLFSTYTAWHFMNHDPVIGSEPPAIERLKDIRARTLVLVGELEPPDFQAISKVLSERIPNVQTMIFDDIGHVLPMEAPEKFNEVVLNFLAEK